MNKQKAIEILKNADTLTIQDTRTSNLVDMVIKSDVIATIELIDETQKPVIPQFVAEFITEQKKLGHTLSYSIDASMSYIVAEWYWDNSELFARAWLDGYEVEKEKRYEVRLKNIDDYLVKTSNNEYHFYHNIFTQSRNHTRKELEQAGFGWVFDCPGIEIEEVEE